jgi:hypothetical protein
MEKAGENSLQERFFSLLHFPLNPLKAGETFTVGRCGPLTAVVSLAFAW